MRDLPPENYLTWITKAIPGAPRVRVFYYYTDSEVELLDAWTVPEPEEDRY